MRFELWGVVRYVAVCQTFLFTPACLCYSRNTAFSFLVATLRICIHTNMSLAFNACYCKSEAYFSAVQLRVKIYFSWITFTFLRVTKSLQKCGIFAGGSIAWFWFHLAYECLMVDFITDGLHLFLEKYSIFESCHIKLDLFYSPSFSRSQCFRRALAAFSFYEIRHVYTRVENENSILLWQRSPSQKDVSILSWMHQWSFEIVVLA